MTRTVAFQVSKIVPTPAPQVWAVLGDFGTEHRWTRSLTHCDRDTESVAVGTTRTCDLPKPLMGRTQVRETLTTYQPGVELAYRLHGSAGPFAEASSRWALARASANETTVTVHGQFVPRNRLVRFTVWPVVKPLLRRTTARVLDELSDHVSTPPANPS